MTIPSVMQGLIETEDGKVFDLDSPKGSAWLESIGSFRFEPSGDNKPYTVRKESGIYWYGCRKVAGKVRKKYIGKSSEVTLAKLEEIAEALEIPPVPRANKVAEVAQVAEEVTEVAQVAEEVTEVAQDRLTALELQVANLQKAVEALQEALPGKLESGDFLELPKVDNKVAEQLQNELSNLQLSEGNDEGLKRLLAKKGPLIPSDLWQEIEKLKERNHQLRLKIGEERRSSIEKISELEHQAENLMRRNQEKQARLDELEIESLKPNPVESALRTEIGELQTKLSDLKQKSATASELPEAADLLNQLKAKRKKSKTDLADLEAILEILES
jgi:chromosome segregation ATPase